MGPETQGFLLNCWHVAAWDPLAHLRRTLGKLIAAEKAASLIQETANA